MKLNKKTSTALEILTVLSLIITMFSISTPAIAITSFVLMTLCVALNHKKWQSFLKGGE